MWRLKSGEWGRRCHAQVRSRNNNVVPSARLHVSKAVKTWRLIYASTQNSPRPFQTILPSPLTYCQASKVAWTSMFPSPLPGSRSVPVQSNSSCLSHCLSSPQKLCHFLNFVFGYTTTLPLASTGGTASSENMQNYGEVVNVGICYVITPLTNGNHERTISK